MEKGGDGANNQKVKEEGGGKEVVGGEVLKSNWVGVLWDYGCSSSKNNQNNLIPPIGALVGASSHRPTTHQPFNLLSTHPCDPHHHFHFSFFVSIITSIVQVSN
jgi:hypothetical protein